VRHGVIARADLELLSFVDDPGTALANLQAAVEPESERLTPAIAHAQTPLQKRATDVDPPWAIAAPIRATEH
jgi:hypothetical protein